MQVKGYQRPMEGSQAARAKRPALGQPEISPKTAAGPHSEPSGLGFDRILRESIACGIIVLEGSRIVTLTPEAAQILGLNPEPAANATAAMLPAPVREIIKECAAAGPHEFRRQIDLAAPRQSPVIVSVRAVRLPQKKSDPTLVLVLNQVSSPRQVHDNLRQLDRLASVGTLSASMIHEIKNALVAGKTFFDLLLERHQDAELVDIVRREMGRIDSIVSQMLKFASPVQANQTIVHVHQILEHSLRLIQPQLEAKAIALARSFAARSDLVSGDDYQLQQAFVNLLMNALEATQPHGAVSVATRLVPRATLPGAAKPAHLCVVIQDSGSGISPENMGRLFEPFFTTKPEGTGLGLPITHRIIQEHRGTIRVDSEPNKGATFSILLPTLNPG
jgi:signal transduction histidine kinase